MIERCFKRACTMERLRGGVAGPFLDGFAEALLAEGYTPETSSCCLRTAEHLCEWAARRRVAIADLDEKQLGRFVQHLSRCRCRGRKRLGQKRVGHRARGFLRYLRKVGVVTTCAPIPRRSALLSEYEKWMRSGRSLAESTIAHSVPVVDALLCTVGGEPTRLDATVIRTFVLEYIQQHAPRSAGCVTTIIRCFLRWLVARGQCVTDLADAVPKIALWRLAKLPRYLPDDDVERIIAACDRASIVTRRDRAMLLLLARLGLRASDVVGLRLGDLDWERGRLRVIGKGRRETRLPLPQDVGDALLGYLEFERPADATDRIFLTPSAPVRPISCSGLRDVVARAFERAGVRAPSCGPHVLRHSLATRLLREGSTLDTIGALLRHRDVNTTALYAKVDVTLLRQIAQPWPHGAMPSC